MKFLSTDIRLNSFSEIPLALPLKSYLEKMKIEHPTLIQKLAFPVALAHDDLIGIAETGSGKTLIYILTILTKLLNNPDSRALILTPSRETADQVFRTVNDAAEGLSISTCLVVAGLPDKVQISQLKKNPRLIVATPGRLLEHLAHNKLLLQKLSIFVIDEADRMLNEGFGIQLKKIKATLRGDFQTMMLSANFHPAAQKFSEGFFRPNCYLIKTVGAEKPVSSLKQIIIITDFGFKKDRLLKELVKSKGRCIVFVNDQPDCESVHNHLSENGLSVDVIHGAFKHGHRERVMRDFRNGEFQILITTDLLARGLDIPDIEFVVNFDLPNETEDFLHRIGRTARAGKKGTAITFVTRAEENLFKKFKSYVADAEVRRETP